jgi:hypothetical protein
VGRLKRAGRTSNNGAIIDIGKHTVEECATAELWWNLSDQPNILHPKNLKGQLAHARWDFAVHVEISRDVKGQ